MLASDPADLCIDVCAVTHAHTIGALHQLLDAYPAAKVRCLYDLLGSPSVVSKDDLRSQRWLATEHYTTLVSWQSPFLCFLAQVVVHEGDAPFLVGSPPRPFFDNVTLPAGDRVVVALGLFPTKEAQRGVPPHRLVVLRGEGGDVADAGKAAGPEAKHALRWLPRGQIR
jgi:hypothetical protein